MLKVLNKSSSILNQIIAELRDVNIQNDRMRFRTNLQRFSEFVGYEISKTLEYEDKEVVTPLGTATVPVLKEYPVIASILRAGLPMHNGLLNVFDKSDSSFVSAYRKVEKNVGFTIKIEYSTSPELDGKVLILADPMLATGFSLVKTYKELMTYGTPSYVHLICAISSSEGVDYVRKNLPMRNISLWLGAIDDEMTAQAYIVPGLGDAGDLAFGNKISI